ncbi:MAG: histidine phosphatase family protein [Actinobacteria bacterium]|nr:histidine phosphatase family protein [Actinomycetota bacterium]
MARLHLIRHAATSDTGIRLTGRLPGVGLDPTGRSQAQALADLLAGTPLEAIYSSPLRRCRETARAIGSARDLDPIPYHSLIEVDYGTWSGRTFKSLRRAAAAGGFSTAPSRFAFPGGEAVAAVQGRAVAACETLAAVHGDAPIALVTHGDIIRTVLAHYLGTPLDLFRRLLIDPASISIVDLSPGSPPVVSAVNRVVP